MNFAFIFAFSYSVVRISYGLLVHPYQTAQLLVVEKVFVWLTLLPSLLLVLLTLIWKFFKLIPIPGTGVVSFLATWVSFFCLYWQVLLGYLLVRFKKIDSE